MFVITVCYRNALMWILRATLMVLVLHYSSTETNHLIKWQILNPPIVFGQDVVLFCNASLAKKCCMNTATWMKGFDVIVHHRASTNVSKYIHKKQRNGFLLIIKNFDEDDINQQYTCLYDFSSYSAVLGIDRHNFKYIPNEDELETNINKISDNTFVADVSFLKVYPQPECILVGNRKKINTNVTVGEEAKIGHFYKIKLHLVFEIQKNKCMDSVSVLCTIGKDEIVVYNKNLSNCPDINDSLWFDKNSLDHKLLVVLIFSGLLLCVTFIAVFVIMWKKRQCSSRTTFSLMEGSAANSTRSENCCVRFLEMRDNSYGEESEMTPLLKSNSDMTYNDRCYVESTSLENQINASYTSHEWTSIPAQRDEDVTDIVNYGTRHDPSYINKLITNIKINIAGLRKEIKKDKSMIYQSYGPAKKVKDVINMIIYAKISDKDYAEKVVSDVLINNARRLKAIPSFKPRPSIPGPLCQNVSDVDVIKGSSRIPTWGVRKRSRISITGKQGPSMNENINKL